MPNATIRSRGSMEDVLLRCGAFAASLGRIPSGLRIRLRAQLVAVVAASLSADQRDVTAWARRSTGPHPLLGFSHGVARMESIVAGVARAAGAEWGLLGRAGAPAIVAALSLGAAAGKTLEEVELAQAAAVELALRFGLATMLGPHIFDDAPCVAAVAGAVASGRILGLDARQMANAIASAMTESSALDGVIAAEHAFESAGRNASPSFAFAPAAFARLGDAWLARTVQINAHSAPASAQSAIDGTREVLAQARVVRRTVPANQVRSLEVESSIFGASLQSRPRLIAAIAQTGVPVETIRVRHAWDLTSTILFRVAETIDARTHFKDVASLPLRLARVAQSVGLGTPPVTQLAADATRLLRLRSGAFDPQPFSLGNRVLLTMTDGQRFAADRSDPPAVSDERALGIARARLLTVATARFGARRAERLFEAIARPRAGMLASELVAMMR